MPSDELIEQLRRHEPLPEARLRQSATFPKDLIAALPSLDEESRSLAVEALASFDGFGGSGAGGVLLKLTHGYSPLTSLEAMEAMARLKVDPPTVAAVLAAVPNRREPAIRSRLYRFVGLAGDDAHLEELRKVAMQENDTEASEDAQAAAVKLGGAEERLSFFRRIENAVADQVLRVRDQMKYVDDVDLAKALLPWLSKEDGVSRYGSDRDNRMVRMCDWGVLTARELGVQFVFEPPRDSIVDLQVRKACEAALRALPDPPPPAPTP